MTSLVFMNPRNGLASDQLQGPHRMAEYRKELKAAMPARRTVGFPVTKRELTKPFADHVENITNDPPRKSNRPQRLRARPSSGNAVRIDIAGRRTNRRGRTSARSEAVKRTLL